MAQLQKGLKPFRSIPRDIVEWTTWMREQDSVLREYASEGGGEVTQTVVIEGASDGCLYEIKDIDADYALSSEDAGKILRSTAATGITVTFNSGVFQIGEQITVYQAGAGQVTIAAGSGVTINTPATLTIFDQYASVSLVLVENDDWFIAGRMTPDGTIKATYIDSESAADGRVLTADGSGNAAWEVVGSHGVTLLDDVNLDFGTGTDWRVDYNSASSVLLFTDALNNSKISFTEGAAWKLTLDNSASHLWLRDGYTLRVSDSTDADYAEFSHDGTNFNIDSVNTTYINFNDAIVDVFQGLRVRDGKVVTIFDVTDAKNAQFSHDSTDFNTSFTNTTDWNVKSGVEWKLWNSGETSHFRALHTTQTVLDSTAGNFVFRATATSTSMQFYVGGTTEPDEILRLTDGTGALVRNGNELRVYDADDTDYAAFSHNGTDFNTTYANTGYANYTGLTSGYSWTVNGTEKMVLGQNYLNIKGDADLRIYDATDTDTAIFNHDGTNFNTTFSGTTKWNVSIGLAADYFQLQNVTSTNIASVTHAINTDAGKVAGAMIWDSTNNKIKVATGSADASTWVDADGTNAVTPA